MRTDLNGTSLQVPLRSVLIGTSVQDMNGLVRQIDFLSGRFYICMLFWIIRGNSYRATVSCENVKCYWFLFLFAVITILYNKRVIHMKLQDKLYKLRKEKGMSQLELAEVLNVSRQSISKWEVGTAMPSVENLVAISKLYGVSVDYLLKEDEISDLRTPKACKRSFYRTTIISLIMLLIAAITAIIIGVIKRIPVTTILAVLVIVAILIMVFIGKAVIKFINKRDVS